jgi:ArsR family transcriptional regulator, arsenate/arsenite/antimonite-responsive transcriptional repressor
MRDLALFYAALADETRLRLLCLMENGEICVCHLQGILKSNQPKISRHLAYLRKAGLVAVRREGKWSHYRLKQLDAGLGSVLAQTLSRLKREPEIKRDLRRRKQSTC